MEERRGKFRALAFDIDGTLYSNTAMYRATAFFVARHLRLFRAFGKARKLVRGIYPLDDLEAKTVELSARELGWGIDRTRQALRTLIYSGWETRLHRVTPFEGVRDFVLWLRRQGVKTAAMSDFPVENKLRVIGLEGIWDVAFSSEETGYLKPREEPFRRLIRDLQVPAEEILYVGNSYEYDVLGAAAVGLHTAHLSWRVPRGSIADFTFSHYGDLRKWVEPRIVPQELD